MFWIALVLLIAGWMVADAIADAGHAISEGLNELAASIEGEAE